MNYELGTKAATQIQLFTDLDAWKKGHELVLMVYRVTRAFPKEEMFGLVSQMRRSAVSVTSNIAEGFSRQSYREKVQFYSMAQGSLTELQNQMIVARDVGFLTAETYQELFQQSVTVHKLMNGLIKKSKELSHYS